MTIRRQFYSRIGVLVTALSLVAAAACGGADDGGSDSSTPPPVSSTLTAATASTDSPAPHSTTAPDGSTSPTAQDNVDRNATVRLVHAITVSQFDPLKVTSEMAVSPWFFVEFDRLLTVGPDNKVVPQLAESYEVSDDGLTWSFTLRHGATFHDGSPIDAPAVVANFQRLIDNKDSAPLVAAKVSGIESVSAADDSRVVFVLKAPDPSFALTVTTPITSIAAPSSFGQIGTQPIGSGPFVLESFSPQGSAFTRYEGYWDVENIPAARLEWTTVSDSQARINAVRTGAADIGGFNPSTLPQIAELGEDPNIVVSQFSNTGTQVIQLNTSHPPLDDPRVRLALSLMIDRAAVASELFGGLVEPTALPVPPGNPGYDAELEKQLAYDPARADHLLETAGVKDLTLSFVHQDVTGVHTQWGPYLQAAFAEHGITLELVPTPAAEAKGVWRSGEGDGIMTYFTPAPDPLLTMASLFTVENPGGMPPDSPIASTLEAGLAVPLDSPQRPDAIRDVVAAAAEGPIHLHLSSQPSTFMASSKLTGLDQAPYVRTYLTVADFRYLGMLAE